MADSKKYIRPGFALSKIMNPLLMFFRLTSVLTVKGRKTGKLYRTPVTPITYQENLYLVAPRGETQWARNLRSSKQGELRIKGKNAYFKATEITGALRNAVVAAYRKEVKVTESQFKELPDPADHPTFQVTLNMH